MGLADGLRFSSRWRGRAERLGWTLQNPLFLFESNSHCTRLFDVLTDDTGA
jgi:hypothetical protein